MISMDDKYRSRGKIGGPGHVVEIDHVEITRTIHMVHGFAAHFTVNNSYHFVDSVTQIPSNCNGDCVYYSNKF